MVGEKGFFDFAIIPAAKAEWPNAADLLQHYFDNSGTDYHVDLRNIVEGTAAGRDLYIDQRNASMDFATNNAIDGKTVTFSSNRLDQYRFTDSDWYHAVGTFSGWSDASVTKNGDEYAMDMTLHLYDRYNWNNGAAVTIGGVSVSDSYMGEFQLMGLAREYNTVGSLPLTITWNAGSPSQNTVKVKGP